MKKSNAKSARLIQINTLLILSLLLFSHCSKEEIVDPGSPPLEPASLAITVTTIDGKTFPDVQISLLQNDNVVLSGNTDEKGMLQFDTINKGTYELSFPMPLASQLNDEGDKLLEVKEFGSQEHSITIDPVEIKGDPIYDNADVAGELRNAAGEIPIYDDEPVYARNWTDDPVGSLYPIYAPDGHHVTLGEWKQASGKMKTYCDGKTTFYDFEFTGLIPDGVYTLWIVPLAASRSYETFTFQDMQGLGALGGPDNNLLTLNADQSSQISVSMQGGNLSFFGSIEGCVLTGENGVIVILDYHIDGRTHGPIAGPDHSEVGHVIFMF